MKKVLFLFAFLYSFISHSQTDTAWSRPATINYIFYDGTIAVYDSIITTFGLNPANCVYNAGMSNFEGFNIRTNGVAYSDVNNPFSGIDSARFAKDYSRVSSRLVTDYLRYSPVPPTRTMTVNGTTFDLSANRTWTLTTANVSESGNLYYTTARFNSAFSGKSTTDLTEGTNLYFTNARARGAISLTTTGSGAATYNSGTGVLNVPTPATGGTVTSIGLTSTDFTVSGSPVTTSGNITANLATTAVTAGTYSGGTYTVDSKGRITAANSTSAPTAITVGTRSFNTAYRESTTRPYEIILSANISCSLTLLAGASGEVVLEISANGTSGWIYCGQVSGSNTGTLTVGLNTVQITGGALSKAVPLGYYYRLRTNNVTGTPTYSFMGGSYTVN